MLPRKPGRRQRPRCVVVVQRLIGRRPPALCALSCSSWRHTSQSSPADYCLVCRHAGKASDTKRTRVPAWPTARRGGGGKSRGGCRGGGLAESECETGRASQDALPVFLCTALTLSSRCHELHHRSRPETGLTNLQVERAGAAQHAKPSSGSALACMARRWEPLCMTPVRRSAW